MNFEHYYNDFPEDYRFSREVWNAYFINAEKIKGIVDELQLTRRQRRKFGDNLGDPDNA